MRRVLVVALVLAALVACDGPPAPGPTSTAPTSTGPTSTVPRTNCVSVSPRTTTGIRYGGASPLQSLDLTLPHPGPRCRPVPVVVWVHGGGFARGDKANGMADKRAWAARNLWALASVNYRLSPAVRHPAHVQDLALAVRYLTDNAATLGIDATRIALAGHSAGAFLVALLGTDDTYLEAAGVEPTHVRAVAALDTRYDIAAEIGDDSQSEAMYRQAFGDDPAVWRAASPLTHAAGDPDVPPFVVVTRGQASRRQAAATFVDAIDAGGGDATLVNVAPLTHEQVNDVLGRTDDTRVTPPVTDLLRSVLTSG